MATTLGSRSAGGDIRVNGQAPWVWALRRAAIGVVILAVTIGAAAWLLYSAIDPDSDASPDARASLDAAPAVVQQDAKSPVGSRIMVAQ